MATAKQVQLSDVPYTEDWNTYEYLVSVNAALASLQKQVDALSNRIDKEGVITGGDDTNGWYAKFPDGKVLQGKFFPAPGAYDITWTFPIAFIDREAYCVSCTPGNFSYPSMCQCIERTNNTARFKIHKTDGSTATDSAYHVMAFGRWK